MKIIDAAILPEGEGYKTLTWTFIPDSALANAGKPFFIPDFADSFCAHLSPAVKISRIGKSIGAKFAQRYYIEVAPALQFIAGKLLFDLTSKGLHGDQAYSFDRSLIVGPFIPIRRLMATGGFVMKKNGQDYAKVIPEELLRRADVAIESVSAYNTLKIGDLILPYKTYGADLAIGDRLEVFMDGEPLLNTAIK